MVICEVKQQIQDNFPQKIRKDKESDQKKGSHR